MSGPLNEIEIGVTVNDDTAAGFASIYARAMAMRAALQGGAPGGPAGDLGLGGAAARAATLGGFGSGVNTARDMRLILQQLRQGGAAHQDLLLTVRQLNAELARTPTTEGGTNTGMGGAAAAGIAAAVASAMTSANQGGPGAGAGNAATAAAAAAGAAAGVRQAAAQQGAGRGNLNAATLAAAAAALGLRGQPAAATPSPAAPGWLVAAAQLANRQAPVPQNYGLAGLAALAAARQAPQVAPNLSLQQFIANKAAYIGNNLNPPQLQPQPALDAFIAAKIADMTAASRAQQLNGLANAAAAIAAARAAQGPGGGFRNAAAGLVGAGLGGFGFGGWGRFWGGILGGGGPKIPFAGGLGPLGGLPPALISGLGLTIGPLHLVTEAVVELAGVLIPAAVAATAFGTAAVPAFQSAFEQAQRLNTVATALGVNIPHMTGAYNQAAKAVQPQVYQLFGDALFIASQKGGEYIQMAKGAGAVTDTLAARFTAAITEGHGFSQFFHDAVPDFAKLGDLTGNLAGVVGAFLTELPGYAQMLLNVADAASKGAENVAQFLKPVIGFGLAVHGAIFYIGLFAAGINLLVTRSIPLLASGLFRIGLGLDALGFDAAASALGNFSAEVASSAALPWGWIAIAAAGVGFLVYKLLTAQSAAQRFNSSLQQTLQTTPITGLFGAINAGFMQTEKNLQQSAAAVLIAGQKYRAALAAAPQGAGGGPGRGPVGFVPTAAEGAASNMLFNAQNNVKGYLQGLQQLDAEQNVAIDRVTSVSRAYGGNANALGLLNAAGITSQQVLKDTNQQWAAAIIQVIATAKAYQEMGQQSGIFGADMNVLTGLADDQYTAIQNLNQQWDTWLNNILTLESNTQGAVTAFGQLSKAAAITGASFKGVNPQSITLQGDFNTLFGSVSQMVNGMIQAKAPVKSLATVISSFFAPAVHAGALANQGFRTALYDLAIRAGFTGPDAIGPLTAFIDKYNKGVLAAYNLGVKWAGNLDKLGQVKTDVSVSGTGTWTVTQGGTGTFQAPGGGKHPVGAFHGMKVPGQPSQGHLILAHGGEAIVPARLTPAVAPFLAAHGVPGFDKGGLVGNYSASGTGAWPGLMQWGMNDTAATVKSWENAIAAATFQGIKQAQANFMSGGLGGINPITGKYGGPVGGATGAANAYAALRAWGMPQSAAIVLTAIAGVESGYNPFALNNTPATGDYSVGDWQINYYNGLYGPRTAEFGPPSYLLGNLGAQARAATILYGQAGFGPWYPDISSGKYLAWLPLAEQVAGAYNSTGNPRLHSGAGTRIRNYDSGNVMPPGLSLAYNGTGGWEPLSPTGGGGSTVVILEVASTGSEFDRFMTNWLQKAVSVKGGGNVQVAFGERV